MPAFHIMRKKTNRILSGAAFGAVGGLLGSWTMNQFQAVISKLHPSKPSGEPATVKVASKVSCALTGRPLRDPQKKVAEPLVHYGFGALVGALYGALAATYPTVRTACGTAYGAAVWLVADEVAVPAAGLSGPPTQTPLPKHAEALGAHLVYGSTLEGVRVLGNKLQRAIRR